MDIIIFNGTDIRKLNLAIEIRKTVFMDEQGVTEEDEFDDKDETSTYVLITDDSGPIGCGRVYFEDEIARFGRIAVIKEHRKSGIGRVIIEQLIKIAVLNKAEKAELGAQLQAVGFYEKLGFQAFGNVYIDAKIPHINMRLEI